MFFYRQSKKKEGQKQFINDYLCTNAHHGCCNNLIREESKNAEKENDETKENLKHEVTLQKMRINNNEETAEIKKKQI